MRSRFREFVFFHTKSVVPVHKTSESVHVVKGRAEILQLFINNGVIDNSRDHFICRSKNTFFIKGWFLSIASEFEGTWRPFNNLWLIMVLHVQYGSIISLG